MLCFPMSTTSSFSCGTEITGTVVATSFQVQPMHDPRAYVSVDPSGQERATVLEENTKSKTKNLSSSYWTLLRLYRETGYQNKLSYDVTMSWEKHVKGDRSGGYEWQICVLGISMLLVGVSSDAILSSVEEGERSCWIWGVEFVAQTNGNPDIRFNDGKVGRGRAPRKAGRSLVTLLRAAGHKASTLTACILLWVESLADERPLVTEVS